MGELYKAVKKLTAYFFLGENLWGINVFSVESQTWS